MTSGGLTSTGIVLLWGDRGINDGGFICEEGNRPWGKTLTIRVFFLVVVEEICKTWLLIWLCKIHWCGSLGYNDDFGYNLGYNQIHSAAVLVMVMLKVLVIITMGRLPYSTIVGLGSVNCMMKPACGGCFT